MYPRLCPPKEVKADERADLPDPNGVCRLLIVLLNPGSGPNCSVNFPTWIGSPLASPTNRTVADLVQGCAQVRNWGQNDYARIVCLFQTTGRRPNVAFNVDAEPKFPDAEAIEIPKGPVVFGWGRFGQRQILANKRNEFIEHFQNAVGALYVSDPCGFASIAPGHFNGPQPLTPAHPAARAGGWPNAVIEAIVAGQV